jgi:hypothetical protein
MARPDTCGTSPIRWASVEAVPFGSTGGTYHETAGIEQQDEKHRESLTVLDLMALQTSAM